MPNKRTSEYTTVEQRISAELVIYGCPNPAEISDLLGIKPTDGIGKGEAISNTQLHAKQDVWIYTIGPFDDAEPEEVLNTLLDTLEPIKLKVADIAKRYHSLISVFGNYYHAQVGLRLDKEQLQRIVEMNLAFDTDFYAISHDYFEDEEAKSEVVKRIGANSSYLIEPLSALMRNSDSTKSAMFDLMSFDLSHDERNKQLEKIRLLLADTKQALNNSDLERPISR